jgi:hypothetical protein
MKYSQDKRIAGMVRELIEKGWRYLPGGKHGKLVAPNGRRLAVPGTPSDWRSGLNFERDARRISRTFSS